MSARGQRPAISSLVMSAEATPQSWAVSCASIISSTRSAVRAMVMEPACVRPRSVLLCKREYRSGPYCARRVRDTEPRAFAMRPAACQVVPLVRTLRSIRSTSAIPSFPRWKATLEPTIPPPTTITDARLGSGSRACEVMSAALSVLSASRSMPPSLPISGTECMIWQRTPSAFAH